MTTSDAFTLSLDPSCSPSSSVGVNTPPQDGSTTGLSQLDVLLPLSRSGTVFLCYLSSAAYGNPYPLTPPIVVDAIYATGVTPFNETYASGTIVTLTFLGDLLSPENDRAELHVSGGGECDDPTPLRMRQSGGSFKVKVTAVTEYTVCYATNATGMTPISGASVRVVPRFYEPAEENLFFFGKIIRSEFVFRIIGYGLDPRRDVVWMQLEPPASNGTCSSSPPENALLPSNVSTDNDGVHHVQIPLSASGYHVLCYSQPSEGVLLTSIDVLGIQPAAPSSIVPTAGSASRRANVSFVGGEGLDLVTRDKAVVCSVEVVLEPTGPRSFFFTPPDVGYFELCFVSGVLTNGRTTTVTARVVPAFSAYPVIDAATFSSRVSQAATAVTLTLIGFGLTSSDNVYICGANESLPVLGNPDASFFSPTRVTLYQWSVVFAKAGTFQLCYTSQASPALAPQRVGEAVVIEPAISRLFPSRLYAGIESSVNFTGISLSTISSLYFVHASSSSGCAVTPSTSPIVTQRPQVDQIRATIPSRGTYSLCFTGISGTAFAAAESLTVVPTVLSMTATSPNQIYSGCHADFVVVGGGLDPSIDIFYLSSKSSCSTVDSILSTASSGSALTSFGVSGVVPSEGTFTLCFAAGGDTSAAPSYGTVHSQSAFAISTGTDGSTTISYQCTGFPANSAYVFSLQVASGRPFIPISESLAVSWTKMMYLPSVTVTLRLDTTPPNGTVYTSTMSYFPPANSTFCTRVPQNMTTSAAVTRFAEAIFALMLYTSLQCATVTTQSPEGLLIGARLMLKGAPTLMSDPETMLAALSAVLTQTTDPVLQADLLLSAAAGDITPYEAASSGKIVAHLDTVRDALTLIATASSGSTITLSAQNSLVSTALNHLNLVASCLCTNGESSAYDEGNYMLATLRDVAGSTGSFIAVDSLTSATVTMAFTSATGYCIGAIRMPQNLLDGTMTLRQNQRVEPTAPSPTLLSATAFNLPLFSLAVDPATTQSPVPRIATNTWTYTYPASMVPASSSYEASLVMYRYEGSVWVYDNSILYTINTQSRQITFNVSSSTNVAVASGILTFTPHEQTHKDTVIDVVLLITTAAVALLCIVCVVFGRLRDASTDATHAPDVDAIHAESVSWLSSHRYVCCVRRVPHHPTSTPERVAHCFSFIAASLLCSIVIAKSGQAPNNKLVGLLSGLVAAVLATPLASLVRISLFMQLLDRVSLVGSIVAVLAGLVVSLVSTWAFGAVACAGAGFVSMLLLAFGFRHTWSMDVQPRPGPIPTILGWALAGLLLLGSACAGVYFSVVSVLLYEPRHAAQATCSLLWAIGLDAIVLEPIKCGALFAASQKVAAMFHATTKQAVGSAHGLRALQYEDSLDLPVRANADALSEVSSQHNPISKGLYDEYDSVFADSKFGDTLASLPEGFAERSSSGPLSEVGSDAFVEVVVGTDGNYLEEMSADRESHLSDKASACNSEADADVVEHAESATTLSSGNSRVSEATDVPSTFLDDFSVVEVPDTATEELPVRVFPHEGP